MARRSDGKLVFQRPREPAVDDSDDDIVDEMQRLAFPIGRADSAYDASVPPGDGMEYLRRVREQAMQLPLVTRSPVVPKEIPAGPEGHRAPSSAEKPAAKSDGSNGAHVPRGLAGSLLAAAAAPVRHESVLPQTAWQRQVLAEFGAVRDLFSAARPKVGTRGEEVGEVAWSKCAPKLSQLAAYDQRDAATLLEALVEALRRDGGPSPPLARWMYAVLARLDKVMDADTCSTVRGLFNLCVQLRAELADSPSLQQTEQQGSDEAARLAALNVLITLCGGFFRQAPDDEWLGLGAP